MTSEFNVLLREFRRAARMTQEALAERAEVGVRTIRGLETGERSDPRIDTVRRLADALGLDQTQRDELLAAAVGRPSPAKEPDAAEPAAGAVRPDPLAEVAEQLARAVAARWQHEEEQRQVQDPYPLPVRWTSMAEELTDHWANIRRLAPGDPAGPLELDGQLAEIVPVYRRVASGRLVVLGRSGSGKTILALRFVLDQLAARQHTDAVPVMFSIGSWNPTTITLRDWLAAQLVRDHPGLAAIGPGGTGLAAALVETGRVLPVLDGFDEIADGLRRPALEALNATTTLPLVLTSRPAEYAAAVAETDVLTAAAGVELTDLTLADLADYLPRTTRRASGPDPAATAWGPVLACLRDQPDTPVSVHLRTVLTTPLMVTLARTIYSDTPDHDPATLLDATRFGGVDELEDHLLDNLIPTVYRRVSAPEPRFDPHRAQRWLGYLADHLTRLGTPDLAWWRLGTGLRRPTRTLVTALLTGLTIGLVDLVVAAAFNSFVFKPLDVLLVGAPSGVMFGLAYWITVAARNREVTPSAVRVRIRGRAGKPQLRTGPRLMIGLLCGGAFGGCYGLAVGVANALVGRTGFSVALSIALADGLVLGLVFGLSAALGFGLVGRLEAPLDIGSAVNPMTLLHTNRRTVATQLLLWAPTFGLLVGFGAGAAVSLMRGVLGTQAWSAADSVGMGVTGGVSGALGYLLALTAWGQWAVFSRIWLPLTGKLPWSVVAFLEDAYRRGVLRQAGAVYQFRHARLQHHLARAYRALEQER